MTAFGKLIEVESGITIWYGRSEVETLDPNFQRGDPWWWTDTRRPALLATEGLANDLAKCVTRNVLSTEPIP